VAWRSLQVGDKTAYATARAWFEYPTEEDKPFLPDGTPLDISTAVPSRMNYRGAEMHLGLVQPDRHPRRQVDSQVARRGIDHDGVSS
jgi:DNA-directed RNA polymerase beta subunit